MEKGLFCLSIDTELLWGRKENPQEFIFAAAKIRPVVNKLLKLFKKHDFSATWALVGQLFNPGDPAWHAPEMIKAIQKDINQEIACHSYCHPDFSKISIAQAKEEIKKCVKIAQKKQIRFKSFVFPYNRINHLSLLKKAGFTSFRDSAITWWSYLPGLAKVPEIIDFLLPTTPPVALPRKDASGLVAIPSSMYYVSQRGLRRFLPIKARVVRAQRGLYRAAQERKIFHLWLHAIDLVKETDKMLVGLEAIIDYASQLQRNNQLENKTMRKIAEEFKD